jgi:hypothetical protein
MSTVYLRDEEIRLLKFLVRKGQFYSVGDIEAGKSAYVSGTTRLKESSS